MLLLPTTLHGALAPRARVAGWTRAAKVPCGVAPLMASPRSRTSHLWSPSDLTTFMESPWVSWLERLAREVPTHPLIASADAADPFLEMLGRKGTESEAAVLSALRLQVGGGEVVDLSDVRGSAEARVAATADALARTPAVVYQAPLMSSGFFGVADFLVRVDALGREVTADGSGARYMVWDAKLARRPRPSHVLQLCCYAEMLSKLQGSPVESVGLILGSTPLILRVGAYDALFRRTRARFLAAQNAFSPEHPPELPEPNVQTGRWSSLAASELLQRDDLRLVARLTRSNAAKLCSHGVRTATELADLAFATPLPRVEGIPPAMLRRLVRQAELQRRARASPTAPPPFELLSAACAPLSGLGALPPPHPADAFFDLEGFPFATLPAAEGGDGLPDLIVLSRDADAPRPQGLVIEDSDSPVGRQDRAVAAAGKAADGGGREYLWGVSLRPSPGDGDEGRGVYLSWWAHTAEEERAAFVDAVDWMIAARREQPGMHIYHYGAYELSVLRRLSGRYGTREAEVDELLRSGALIDLYEVVRASLMVGEPRYSIKNIERLYRPSLKRETDVAKGDQSVAVYANWLDAPDGPDVKHSPTLSSLAEYNRDDCESTRQLADWLWGLRCERCLTLPGPRVHDGDGPDDANDESGVDGKEPAASPYQENELEVVRLVDALEAPGGWPAESALAASEPRATLAGMLRYHRREAKPQWWRRFDWLGSPPAELVSEARTLGALVRTDAPAYKSAPRKRRLAYEYSFDPSQEVNLAEGSSIVLRDDDDFVLRGGGLGSDQKDGVDGQATTFGATLHRLDRTRGIAVVECGLEPPATISALPNEFVDASPVERALREHVAAIVAAPVTRTAFTEILARRPPVLDRATTRAEGKINNGSPTEPRPTLLDAGCDPVSAAVASVRALHHSYLCVQGPPGTGKTYTAARCISALVSEGRRVGVMAVSHRAITNLMARAISTIAGSDGSASCGALKLGGSPAELKELQDACEEGCDVVGGDASRRVHARQLRGASALGRSGLEDDELLIGGTAWAFSSERLRGELDVLFVDEAGQLPLAQLAGAARSAQSIVLLGDQMQLPAPSEGCHPGESGASCLEYLLQDAECVPPSMGIFLPTTFRMHPQLCELVSDLSYRGLLRPHPDAAARVVELNQAPSPLTAIPPSPPASPPLPTPPLPQPILDRGAGAVFVPVHHEGNGQTSPEEVNAIRALCSELFEATYVDGETRRPLTAKDVLVVAPYNLQVRALEAALPPGVRVGTVDRFQGQEAPVVILSLCHSEFTRSGASLSDPSSVDASIDAAQTTQSSSSGGGDRGLSFVLNPNRLNVALSRAQCLAIVVGSPRLANTTPKTLQQQRELNVLCRIMEMQD
jgi:predicted RecB family nuclease